MIIILNFSKNTELVPFTTQEKVNTYIHDLLGRNNKYHDTFSEYAISSLQGSVSTSEGLNFPNGGKIFISTDDMEFLNLLFTNINKEEFKDLGWGMKFINSEFKDFNVNDYCDKVQTICPILLNDSTTKKSITFNDEQFIEELEKNCRKKLSHYFDDKKLSTFKIEINKVENAKVKKILVHNVLNICSSIRLRVVGDKEVRKKLYTLGFGKSTGCGFGSVKILTR